MTENYDTLEKQSSYETRNEVGYREMANTLEIYDLKSEATIVVPYKYMLNTYRYFLEDYIVEVELNDVEYELYRQNPHFMSEALYGTTHLWHSLLELNGCVSRIDFNKKKVRHYDPSMVLTLINEVKLKNYQLEHVNIY